ncbi:hypothetical protein, partial [Brevibacillus invocatus]|uniref:hypothetical protein n=1 Tax=Brevibacillus invocatus TaxID=173959 RepID=UPI001C831510
MSGGGTLSLILEYSIRKRVIRHIYQSPPRIKNLPRNRRPPHGVSAVSYSNDSSHDSSLLSIVNDSTFA